MAFHYSPRTDNSRAGIQSSSTASTTISSNTTEAAISNSAFEGPPAIPFISVTHLLKLIDQDRQEVLIFANISPEQFSEIETARETEMRKFRCSFYSTLIKKLLVVCPTEPHEKLYKRLCTIINRQLDRMDLGDDLEPYGNKTHHCRDANNTLLSQGEGDEVYRPASTRPNQTDYPTLVIESGYTQTWPSLRQKAHWWFRTSEFQVKIVLLIKADWQQRSIMIEKWKGVSASPPAGATTRARSQVTAQQTQTISITWTPTPGQGANTGSYVVIRHPLRLEFEDLFVRPPNQGEGDLVLTDAHLQTYATRVGL